MARFMETDLGSKLKGLSPTETDADELAEADAEQAKADAVADLTRQHEAETAAPWRGTPRIVHPQSTEWLQESLRGREFRIERAPAATIGKPKLVALLSKKQGKADMSLLPGSALRAACAVMTKGNEKYDEGSWVDVSDRDLVNAALRHLYSHADGEILDDESGLPHLDHALAGLMFAVANSKKGLDAGEPGR